MYLITTYQEGFIAQENIVVYKPLCNDKDGKWITVNKGLEVKLESELTSSPKITKNAHNCVIEEEITHSYTYSKNNFYNKAIIPKGTRFWIQDNLLEIVSEKLYITSEREYGIFKTNLSFLYFPHCLDLLTNDGWRISWSPEVNPKDIKGIFVYDSQAMGLNLIYSDIFSDAQLKNLPRKISENDEAEKDFSGRERTQYLREHYPDIPVLRKLPEDSYIPASGEILKALENYLLINLTRQALGLEVIGYSWFWSSTPNNEDYGWYVCPDEKCWLSSDGELWDLQADIITMFLL